jgi:hypothetical protein
MDQLLSKYFPFLFWGFLVTKILCAFIVQLGEEMGGCLIMNVKMGVITYTCCKWPTKRPKRGVLLYSITSLSSVKCEQIFE